MSAVTGYIGVALLAVAALSLIGFFIAQKLEREKLKETFFIATQAGIMLAVVAWMVGAIGDRVSELPSQIQQVRQEQSTSHGE